MTQGSLADFLRCDQNKVDESVRCGTKNHIKDDERSPSQAATWVMANQQAKSSYILLIRLFVFNNANTLY